MEARQVTKVYGSVIALDKVNFHVKRGSIYGLIGDNGAGKSTLLKLLAGHIYPSAGEIRIFGQFGEKEMRDCRKRMGFMTPRPGFYPDMTVENMLEYYRIQKGIPQREKVEEMLRLGGLKEKQKEKCRKLSQGQQQRLGLAVAMMGEPECLVLDEPVNGLDPGGIIELRELLHKLNQERNITILLSSHILTELQQTASVFGFLHRGRLLEEITAQDLEAKCADYLDITVSDVEAYAAFASGEFPQESFRVMPDGVLRVMEPKREAEAFSRLAAEHGLYLKGLERHHGTLEDYYRKLTREGGKNA